MTIIEWLLEGDIVIQYLANKYLLEQPTDHKDGGYIGRYLDLYDRGEEKWGGSIYTRKWICSTYTLLELKYMEIRYDDPCYQGAAGMVMDDLWKCHGRISKTRYQDMCMSAMVLSIVCYARMEGERIYEIIDYILGHQMKDGGWNCAWDSVHNRSLAGSVHTTLSVLEALADYERYGYGYRLKEIKDQAALGQEYLLRRELFKSLSTGEPIHQDMVHFHYPCRWKYDCFRALEYFTRIGYPYDGRMKDALDKVKAELQKGYINRGKSYAGKVHFPLETGTKGRFNTFRGMFILKCYDKDAYDNIAGLKFSYG
ncbi:hypothetical protein LI031_26990 [Enterocloster citroniae]|uniref:hypothetical protein n=1 Tax=Enterocloster citroniae TaxID=358743 RepID=UPI001D08F34C|nr:hypothetical protein [Enterocloster citroniae]MCB7067509.1 hypothetical protein [Enterocloster citroniae]